ncbi:Abi-alpha family protein [Vibrio vulnificus]|uniref:Abi-alpha family protein n=1 Tax=Vibrio vulnificus TaxID=672 RepID=UPI0009B6F884|nr:Abi-alpha family protein [Vibrio vulnificus]OQK43199.1 hypothetical protein XM74_c11556 [Vibrio vulnificus]POC24598.1 hypothetical protein CRN46_07710 [Vibrio vulnificus]
MEQENDLLGVKPIARAAEKSVDGVGSFLGKICMPVAEELGLYFQDKVKVWRAHNAAKIEEKARQLAIQNGGYEGQAVHPLLAWKIIENGSFADTSELQDVWAGLLTSSMDFQPDDSNHIFIDLVSQLTSIQVRIIEYSCLTANKYVSKAGYIQADSLTLDAKIVFEITGCNDLHRLDREMDHLSNLGLFGGLGGGFHPENSIVDLTPSPLSLQLFARCCGSNQDPVTFYKAKPKEGPAK